MNHEIGFALAGLAGVSLGLMGGGGSLLTVPILIYGFQVSAILGTGYSLFIVGITSLVGAIIAFRKKQVVLSTTLLFSIPSFAGLYLSRHFILHQLPETLMIGKDRFISRESLLMGLFGLMMILAAVLTFRNPSAIQGIENKEEKIKESETRRERVPLLLALGFAVGALTGLFGTGGGFLIVPALVVFARLPLDKAIGTSLAIIAGNAWFGLSNDLGHHENWDWQFILLFSGFSLAGVLVGQYFSSRIRVSTLKMVFAYTTSLLGISIFLKEIIKGFL